jgi:hypothetical protein
VTAGTARPFGATLWQTRAEGSSRRPRLIAFPFGLLLSFRFVRPVFRRIAEDEATIQHARLHPGVAGEAVHPLADAIRFVRTTPTTHICSPNRRERRRRKLHIVSSPSLAGPNLDRRWPEGSEKLSGGSAPILIESGWQTFRRENRRETKLPQPWITGGKLTSGS